MNERIVFHIIVVSYNAGDRLPDTVCNVLDQSYEHVHVIVKDGGSDDGSFEKMKAAFGDDPRVTKSYRRDEGIYDAMNQAIDLSLSLSDKQTDGRVFVLFLNCGDRFADKDVLKKAAKRIRHVEMRLAQRMTVNPGEMTVRLAYGDTLDRTTGQVVSANPVMDDFACYRHLPCHQSTIYAQELLKKERFDLSYKVRADYEHFLRLKYVCGATPRYLKMTIADYEGGGYSAGTEAKNLSEKERQQIIARYLSKEKILKYNLYRRLSLQPLREKLAENEKTAALYQKVKSSLYRRKDGHGT